MSGRHPLDGLDNEIQDHIERSFLARIRGHVTSTGLKGLLLFEDTCVVAK